MTMNISRWLSCDFPGCGRRFDVTNHRDIMERIKGARTMREAAQEAGWYRTAEAEDLCAQHAAVHAGRPEQPDLFAVPDADPTV